MSREAKGNLASLPAAPRMEADIIIGKDLDKQLKKKLIAFDNSKSAFKQLKNYMDTQMQKGFDQERDRETGQRLASLEESTKRRHPHRVGGKILRDRGRLMGSTTKGEIFGAGVGFTKKKKSHALLYEPSRKLGRKGRKISSAYVHQLGSVKNKTPARPYLRLTRGDREEINEIFKSWSIENLRRK